MSPGTISGPAPLGRAQHHQGDSRSTLEMQLSGVSKEGAKLTPLQSELLVFHVCWAPAYAPPAELTLAPRAHLESQKVWLLLSAGLEFSLSFSVSWVEAQKGGGMLRWPQSSRQKHPVPQVLGGLCVTAGEIPTQEGWERQGSS